MQLEPIMNPSIFDLCHFPLYPFLFAYDNTFKTCIWFRLFSEAFSTQDDVLLKAQIDKLNDKHN